MSRAYTWAGVLGHLIGVENHSGQNGLATHAVVGGSWIRIFNASFGTSVRERWYGNQSTGRSVSYSGAVEIPIPNVPAAGVLTGSVRSDFREAALGGRLEVKLEEIFRIGKALADKLNQLRWVGGIFDRIMGFLPEIKLSGELAFYYGLSSQDISYFRIQSAGGVSIKLPTTITRGAANGGLRGVSGGGGRSWQIQMRNIQGHLPTSWS